MVRPSPRGFVESTVNQVVSKRFCKKQQMQWSKRGAHLLLQTRVKTLNRELGRCSSDGTLIWRSRSCQRRPNPQHLHALVGHQRGPLGFHIQQFRGHRLGEQG